nr:MAG TPA: hypothetical protein [Caudoviricetes sp.]
MKNNQNKPTLIGRLYFFTFFQKYFIKTVDHIALKCYNINCKGGTLNNKERRKI